METTYLLTIIVAFVMGWFAFGIIYNLRRGDRLLRWMQGGLPRIGERTTFRWLGSSVAELVIAKARSPFRRMEILVVLAPRDVPWNWLLTHLRGRRDTLILRAHLHIPPLLDLELVDPRSWSGQASLQRLASRNWETGPYQEDMQYLAPQGLLNLANSTLSRLSGPLAGLSGHYYQLSLRKEAPHLEVHIPFPDRTTDAETFFKALQDLAQAVGERA